MCPLRDFPSFGLYQKKPYGLTSKRSAGGILAHHVETPARRHVDEERAGVLAARVDQLEDATWREARFKVDFGWISESGKAHH